ncbi:MAG TPA: bifunctional riboflavin kinase/FAD synthetase [Firmicutes bacterium]|nr:bifunctional riboflavin kinase/FAD synthetase [Bacillota bacterium]
MSVIYHASALPPGGCGVAIGFFDGVHVGHREIIRRLVRGCAELGLKSVVMTFEPHPSETLRPGCSIERLTSLDQKTALIAELGVDYVFVRCFDRELAAQEPKVFVEKVLLGELNAKHVWVGFNFTFGHRASGRAEDLGPLLAQHGVGVAIVEPVVRDGVVVSSTTIRALIKSGSVDQAEKLLGKPFQISGSVQSGDGRGRELGFPTANIAWPSQIVKPRHGVYVVMVDWGEGARLGVANFGPRPTFRSIRELLEVHVIGGARTLYGEELTVSFLKWVRAQKAFRDESALIEQVKQDISFAQQLNQEKFTHPLRYGRIKQ